MSPEASLQEWSPKIGAAGAVVIDNSSAWRMDPDVPLIVPEVNADAVTGFTKKNIIANPNCSTAQLVVALKPLHDKATIKRVVVATYQSVSGAGKAGMDELFEQSRNIFVGQANEPVKFPKQIAFNVIPHAGEFLDDGSTSEEWKMVVETKKILDPKIKVTATCVRVPVFVGHSEAVNIEFERPITAKERATYWGTPVVLVVDKRRTAAPSRRGNARDYATISRIENHRGGGGRTPSLGSSRTSAQGGADSIHTRNRHQRQLLMRGKPPDRPHCSCVFPACSIPRLRLIAARLIQRWHPVPGGERRQYARICGLSVVPQGVLSGRSALGLILRRPVTACFASRGVRPRPGGPLSCWMMFPPGGPSLPRSPLDPSVARASASGPDASEAVAENTPRSDRRSHAAPSCPRHQGAPRPGRRQADWSLAARLTGARWQPIGRQARAAWTRRPPTRPLADSHPLNRFA